ncbi:hypothetical protein GCM10027446_01630 [Angustibacter peucedani]
MTFQNARQWDYGFDLLGIRSGLTKTGRAMTPIEPKASLETRLNSLSHRRNRVVHEGDLVRRKHNRRAHLSPAVMSCILAVPTSSVPATNPLVGRVRLEPTTEGSDSVDTRWCKRCVLF